MKAQYVFMCALTNGLSNEKIYRQIDSKDGWLDEWMDGWMEGGREGRTDRWIDR